MSGKIHIPKTSAQVPESEVPMFDFGVLRILRQREELTLQEVSERSGVSVAVISKLERNQCSAELETLYKLARVFGMNGADLLTLAEAPMAHRKRAVSYTSGEFEFRRIDYSNVNAFLGQAPAGGTVQRPEIHHDDYEVCWVLEGRLCITLAHEKIELSAGESVQFDAIQSHRYEALTDVRLLILHLRKRNRF